VIPLFAFSPEIRKIMHTTNAIESLNMTLRKVTRNHRIFPSDEAVFKVLYLAIHILPRNGPCQSMIGNLLSIALLSNSLAGSLNDQKPFSTDR
jgi:hypothetical protein